MGQMTVEQWYGTIKTGLTKKRYRLALISRDLF